ncbi:hypothetical protein DF057_33485 [Burkholderia cepacia]|nr:hypothetical protein DF057_33485 [Burkholderia cepacia]
MRAAPRCAIAANRRPWQYADRRAAGLPRSRTRGARYAGDAPSSVAPGRPPRCRAGRCARPSRRPEQAAGHACAHARNRHADRHFPLAGHPHVHLAFFAFCLVFLVTSFSQISA